MKAFPKYYSRNPFRFFLSAFFHPSAVSRNRPPPQYVEVCFDCMAIVHRFFLFQIPASQHIEQIQFIPVCANMVWRMCYTSTILVPLSTFRCTWNIRLQFLKHIFKSPFLSLSNCSLSASSLHPSTTQTGTSQSVLKSTFFLDSDMESIRLCLDTLNVVFSMFRTFYRWPESHTCF